MKQQIKNRVAMLLLCDLVAMAISFLVALYLGHRPPVVISLLVRYRYGILTMVSFTMFVYFILDVYSLHKIPERFASQIVLIVAGLFISSALATTFYYFFRDPVPRAVFALFYIFSLLLIVAFRYIIASRSLNTIYWRILVVGDYDISNELNQLIRARKYLHSAVVGYVADMQGFSPGLNLPYLGSRNDLIEIVNKHGINLVVAAVKKMGDDLTQNLVACMKQKVKVSNFRRVFEDITGKVPVEHLTDNWFLIELSTKDNSLFWFTKRAIDVVMSLLGICIVLPIFPLIYLLIKISSPGPVFYLQDRIGRGGKSFTVWKLRTMVMDADKNNLHWTEDGDRRITKIGKYLRKLHIDELPQLYNILGGEMTLVGPRPEATSLVEMYRKEILYYDERHMVTPGVTGWAQINLPYGNSIEDAREKLKYDYYYIKNRSILLDLLILLRTIRTVMTGKGAL